MIIECTRQSMLLRPACAVTLSLLSGRPDAHVEGLLMIAPSSAQDCKPESGGHVLAIVRAGRQPLAKRVQPVRAAENAVQLAIAQRKSPNDPLSIELELVGDGEVYPALDQSATPHLGCRG